MRHEEAAAFAAAGDAAMTGELAVFAASCGPGNLHLVNGLFDAHRSPASHDRAGIDRSRPWDTLVPKLRRATWCSSTTVVEHRLVTLPSGWAQATRYVS